MVTICQSDQVSKKDNSSPKERNRSKCQNLQRLSKATLLAMISPTGRNDFDCSPCFPDPNCRSTNIVNNTCLKTPTNCSKPYCFLDTIPTENWSIISFDPKTRETCIKITRRGGTNIISLILPKVSINSVGEP